MAKPTSSVKPMKSLLGIEGGGTATVALFLRGQKLERWEGGPANLHLVTDPQLEALFRTIAGQFPRPDALAIGLPGARLEADRQRIRRAATAAWPGVPCVATNDLETALAAQPAAGKRPRVLVLSGTGSCCFGRADGRGIRTGGWGHLLGDWGSSYWIAQTALRQTLSIFDHTRRWPALGARILGRLHLNAPEDLIDWVKAASKDQLAALAVEVFNAARQGNRHAAAVVRDAALRLGRDAVACARRISPSRHPVEFVLAGGTILKQPRFAAQIAREIRARWPKAKVTKLARESAWGAVEIAAQQCGLEAAPVPAPPALITVPARKTVAPSPTEERHPRSMKLDQLTVGQALELMLTEEAQTPAAVLAARPALEKAVRLAVRALKGGGRLFYVGAGTSGRLGVLDASECPPTFSVSPERVQGIIAGGARAVFEAVEGAEDDELAGSQAIAHRHVTRRDFVIGIAASGRTPFVWSALETAHRLGAPTALIHCNPRLMVAPCHRQPDVMITLDTGPEILTGSTRLKAGTATKLALNVISTLAMVRLGKVVSNLMVDLNPSNMKLRGRAIRIISDLTGASPEKARAALERHQWLLRKALAELKG